MACAATTRRWLRCEIGVSPRREALRPSMIEHSSACLLRHQKQAKLRERHTGWAIGDSQSQSRRLDRGLEAHEAAGADAGCVRNLSPGVVLPHVDSKSADALAELNRFTYKNDVES